MKKLKVTNMSRVGDRLRAERKKRNMSQAEAADFIGVDRGAFGKVERGETVRPNDSDLYAKAFDIPVDEFEEMIVADAIDAGKTTKAKSTIAKLPPLRPSEKLFRLASPRRRSAHPGMIPVHGQASAGEPGRLIMMNEIVEYIPTPPELEGIDDGYAVYVHGTSMVPRYMPGEKVYVHPHKPIAENNFCVVQVGNDPLNPEGGYIKQYVSWENGLLTLRQYNPDTTMTFPDDDVVSVHRIVGSGES